MKKKIVTVMGITAAVFMLTAISVSAKTVYIKWVNEQIESGYSAEDACGTLAVIASRKENVSEFIYQKHQELGSWESTAEYYGIDIKEFEENINRYKKDIPDNIYREMSAGGMTDTECYNFAVLTSNAQMDIQTTWEGKKNGKTINDLIKERTELKNQQSQAATDFVFGKITEKEYIDKMNTLSPKMPFSKIIDFARTEKRGWMEFRKAASGITDEELEAASKSGITDFFAACRLKDSEKISSKTFLEMLNQVKAGKDVDDVIKDNTSTDKIKDEINKSKDTDK